MDIHNCKVKTKSRPAIIIYNIMTIVCSNIILSYSNDVFWILPVRYPFHSKFTFSSLSCSVGRQDEQINHYQAKYTQCQARVSDHILGNATCT